MNNIEKLINHIKSSISLKKEMQINKLNNIMYIENIKYQLLKDEIQNVDILDLKKIINKIGIEEDDIFLQLHQTLKDFSIDVEELTDNISREKEIELLLTTFQQLQEYADYQDELEEKIVEKYVNVLIRIIDSLFDKEVQNIRKSTEYIELDREIDKLQQLLDLLNKSEILTQEEKDKLYDYIINSDVEDKINIYIELASKWIEQTKNDALLIEEEEEEKTEKKEEILIQDTLNSSQSELKEATKEMSKEEWGEAIQKAISLVNESIHLNQEQKNCLEKILSTKLKEISEEGLNFAKSFLDEIGEVTLISRNSEYLNQEFEFDSIVADLVMYLIPNIENESLPDVKIIIDKIIGKFQQIYLSSNELTGINQIIKTISEKYSPLTYINYTDEERKELESMFIEFKGSKEEVLNFDKLANQILTNGDQYDDFAQNTFNKIIKTKLEELEKLLDTFSANYLVERNKIDKLKEEIINWTSLFEQYIKSKEKADLYKKYSIDELEEINFDNKNIIIFLTSESGKKLYEDGLLTNGQSQNKHIPLTIQKDLKKIIKNAVYNDKNLRTSYRGNRYSVQSNQTSKSPKATERDNSVMIAGKKLERLSEYRSPARLSIISIDNIPDENRKKLGISFNNCIVLVLSGYEINFNKESEIYAQMAKDANYYEQQIQTIVSAFENPDTPREVLLQYVADSYGLVENLIEEPQQSLFENEQGRGGRR